MNPNIPSLPGKILLTVALLVAISKLPVMAQTPFTAPNVSTQTGASTSYSSVVVTPESVNGSCTEVGQTWTNSFLGTANRRLNGFTIAATSYYVNNFGSLTTVMRRNNSSGGVPAIPTCPTTTPPWNDRQIVFFEGTRDAVLNTAQIVNSFPSLTLPGAAGYNAINDMNLVFSRGYINSGADNIFNNLEGSQAGYNSNANNIERMDLFVSGGVTVTAVNMNRVGIVIVCRGPTDDPFVISAMKGLAGGANIGGGTTYIYDDIIKFNATWTSKAINGGIPILVAPAQRTTLIPAITSVVLRRMDSDGSLNDLLPTTEYPTISSNVAAQPITGMFFTFADLGLTPGEVFYGYSVAANDVTAINSTQFNSYPNSTYYPLLTSPADGGVDLTGFPGLFAAVDIDDDDDGIPDYVEGNIPLALGDLDSDGIPNWCDVNYPGFVDNNADGVNDNFDPSADSDNDGILNYLDPTFPGYVDTNADGVNDNFDWDRDGIPNHLDRDSDNDGIPDVVESFGVDADGDGRIDNYTDTDVDGLSQNVDANNTGSVSSGNGLGAIDSDGDGNPNYLDLDSDNDGIPDVIEARGTDANNDGKIDNYTDTDADGFSDNVDGDVGNDGVAENSPGALLRTGPDGDGNGRADSYPNKNFDGDSRPNPYDLDSDGDGITDVREAGFTDADNNGFSDGVKGADGWDDSIDALLTLTLRNSDADPNLNYLDIDSDNDGIPDNIEGMSTSGYKFPLYTDSDGDGIDDNYDSVVGFGGNGNLPNNQDGDALPDYIDPDTDNDGQSDIVEGNDFNLNTFPDDNVTLTGLDTDGDGLDNRFDANNSSIEGTSQYMGVGGSFIGDGTPGSNTMVQRSFAFMIDRDWRVVAFLLDLNFLSVTGRIDNETVVLNWIVTCDKVIDHFDIERSIDGTNFAKIGEKKGIGISCQSTPFEYSDNIANTRSDIFYYRLRAGTSENTFKRSQYIIIRKRLSTIISIAPNPARNYVNINIIASKEGTGDIKISDVGGRVVFNLQLLTYRGINNIGVAEIERLSPGVYTLRLKLGDEVFYRKLVIQQ